MELQSKDINTINGAIAHFERLNDRHFVRNVALKSIIGFYLTLSAFMFSSVGLSSLSEWGAFGFGTFVLWRLCLGLRDEMKYISSEYSEWLAFTFEFFHTLDLSDAEKKVYQHRLRQLTTSHFKLFSL